MAPPFNSGSPRMAGKKRQTKGGGGEESSRAADKEEKKWRKMRTSHRGGRQRAAQRRRRKINLRSSWKARRLLRLLFSSRDGLAVTLLAGLSFTLRAFQDLVAAEYNAKLSMSIHHDRGAVSYPCGSLRPRGNRYPAACQDARVRKRDVEEVDNWGSGKKLRAPYIRGRTRAHWNALIIRQFTIFFVLPTFFSPRLCRTALEGQEFYLLNGRAFCFGPSGHSGFVIAREKILPRPLTFAWA